MEDVPRWFKSIDRPDLSTDYRAGSDVFERELGYRIGNYEYGGLSRNGPHLSFLLIPANTSFDGLEAYEDSLTQVETARAFFTRIIELMRAGIETDHTRPRAVLDDHDGMIDTYLVDDPT